MSLQLIFKDRDFSPLFWVQFLGALNDNFLKNGMVILVEYQSLSLFGLAPSAIVALAGAVFIFPFFSFSMLAGQLADRLDKTRIVRLVKLWELLIAAMAAVGFYQHSLSLLLLALFMMGCHSAFFGPIKYSALPELVPANQLLVANAYVEVATFLAILLGTIGGGLLIARPHGELWLSLALFVCAGLGFVASRQMGAMKPSAPHLKIEWRPSVVMLSTFQKLRLNAKVAFSILGISWFWAFGAVVLSLLPPYCKEYLHTDAQVVTCFLALFTLGIGLGSMLCARLSKGKVRLNLVSVGAVGLSLFLFDLARVAVSTAPGSNLPLRSLSEFAASSEGPRLLADFLMMSVLAGFYILPLYTAMQAGSAANERSRIIAGNNVMNAIFMVMGALLVMILHAYQVSLPNAFLLLAGLNFCVAIWIGISVRRIK